MVIKQHGTQILRPVGCVEEVNTRFPHRDTWCPVPHRRLSRRGGRATLVAYRRRGYGCAVLKKHMNYG